MNLDLGYRGFILSVMSEDININNNSIKSFQRDQQSQITKYVSYYGLKKSNESLDSFKSNISNDEIQEKEKWLLNTWKTSPSFSDANLSSKINQRLKQFKNNTQVKQYVEQAISYGGHPTHKKTKTTDKSKSPFRTR